MGFKAYSGTGTVYMRPVDSAGVPTGNFLPVGDAYPLSCQVQTDQVKVKSRRVETAGQIIASKNEITDTSGNLTLHEWNAANLAWALAGGYTARTASSGTVAAEAVTAGAVGEYVELAHPDVSSVVVKDVSDVTTYVEGTDYSVDAKLGMITILDGGSITAADVLHIDYSYAAEAGYRVEIGTDAQIRVEIKAHLYNEFADKHLKIELDSVVLAASSEINFISEAGSEGEQLQFSMTLETVSGNTSPGRVDGIEM